MKTAFRLLSVASLLALCACGNHGAPANDRAKSASVESGRAVSTAASPAVDLRALILAAARQRHPGFDQAQPQAVVDVDALIQSKAGFESLPSIRKETDETLKGLYAEAATLYQLNEVIAAQELLRTVKQLSPAGAELKAMVDQAYTPVGDPDSLEVEGYSADTLAQELQDYAARAEKAFKVLRQARLEGQQQELAEFRVKAGVYHDTNAAAIDAAEAALAATGSDPKTRRAIEKALTDAAQ